MRLSRGTGYGFSLSQNLALDYSFILQYSYPYSQPTWLGVVVDRALALGSLQGIRRRETSGMVKHHTAPNCQNEIVFAKLKGRNDHHITTVSCQVIFRLVHFLCTLPQLCLVWNVLDLLS